MHFHLSFSIKSGRKFALLSKIFYLINQPYRYACKVFVSKKSADGAKSLQLLLIFSLLEFTISSRRLSYELKHTTTDLSFPWFLDSSLYSYCTLYSWRSTSKFPAIFFTIILLRYLFLLSRMPFMTTLFFRDEYCSRAVTLSVNCSDLPFHPSNVQLILDCTYIGHHLTKLLHDVLSIVFSVFRLEDHAT